MNSFHCLDLDVILNRVATFAPIAEAASFIIDENIDYNPLLIKKKNQEVKEALNLLNNNIIVHFDGIVNVNELLRKADKNMALSGIELKRIEVFHNHCSRLKAQFSKFDSNLVLRDYTDSINISEKVFDEVAKCIDNSGEVKEDANCYIVNLAIVRKICITELMFLWINTLDLCRNLVYMLETKDYVFLLKIPIKTSITDIHTGQVPVALPVM